MTKFLEITRIGVIIILLSMSASAETQPVPQEFEGTVLSVKGKIVAIKLDAPAALFTKQAVEVYKFFNENILGMQSSGWLLAAEAKVVSIKENEVSLEITAEKSNMVINGKKIQHLKKDARIKLAVILNP